MIFLYQTLLLLSSLSLFARAAIPRVRTCQYELLREEVLREEATLRCEKMKGKLAIIHSVEQNEEVRKLLVRAGVESAWIGLFLSDRGGQWDDGSELGFSKLPHGTKGADSGANVLIHHASGSWSVMETKHFASFICSVHSRYFLFSTPLSHHASARTCSQHNMTLARVSGSKDARLVKKEIRMSGGAELRPYHWFWVDGENPTATGIWQWSDGTPAENIRLISRDEQLAGPLYLALHKGSARMRPLHDYFLNPFICQCPPGEMGSAFRAQLDYGQINSEGQYVALFKSFSKSRLRVVNLEHDHESDTEEQLRYSYHPARLTHGAAQSHCRVLGGDLACPRTPLQQSQILAALQGNAWLGLVDVEQEGEWRCVGDDARPTSTQWYRGFGPGALEEPDNMTDRRKPGAAYVQMLWDPDRSWRHGRWIDRGAPQYEFLIRSGYVCEHRRT